MMGARKGLSVRAGEGRFASILEAHRAHAAEAGAVALTVPKNLAEAVVLYEGYVRTAMD